MPIVSNAFPIKIVSDGTREGTKVINAKTGEILPYVISVDFHMSSSDYEAQVTLHIPKAELEIEGELYSLIDGQIRGVLLPSTKEPSPL